MSPLVGLKHANDEHLQTKNKLAYTTVRTDSVDLQKVEMHDCPYMNRIWVYCKIVSVIFYFRQN
jgi:hypothetical protein